MHLLAPFILQNCKKIFELIQSYEDMPFSGPKWCICPEQNFFGTNYYYYFHLAIGPFHCAKLKKIVTMDPELWGCTIFGPKMVPFASHKFFFLKIINIILIYQLVPFIVQNFKKILPADPELWKLAIFGPKMAHFPKWHLKKNNLVMSLVSFIRVYLYSTNESQILICYWNIDD